MLEARGIPAGEDRLSSEVTGEVEVEDGVLVVKRIHVVYSLELDPSMAEVAARAHRIHQPKCPVYKTLEGCVEMTTELTTRSP